jgi:hypothetical protein
MSICEIAGCNNTAIKGGSTCSLECGRKYAQINASQKLEDPTKPENDFGVLGIQKIYYDYDHDIVEWIKKRIVQYKVLPQDQKALFFKNKIKPIVEQINGDTPKWNAVCIHLKSQYSKPQYQFIIDAFDSLGMKIYS